MMGQREPIVGLKKQENKMKPILFLSLKNVFEKKFRSFMIIISVVLSVALMYTILALSTTITDYYTTNATKTVGETDIFVTADENATTPLIQMDDLQISVKASHDIDYTVPFLQGYGYYDVNGIANPIQLTGLQEGDFAKVYGNSTFDDAKDSFYGNRIVLGEFSAKKLSLKKGDTLSIVFNNIPTDFLIYDIIKDHNLLSSSDQLQSCIIPLNTMEQLLGVTDKATLIHVAVKQNLNSDIEISKLITSLSKDNPMMMIKQAVNTDDLGQMLRIIQVSLSLMTMSVILISCFIIYSTFKIIIIERMEFIGTLRSLGATKKASRKVLLVESSYYGIIGGIVGIGLGLFMLQFTINQIFNVGEITTIQTRIFYPEYALISFGAAILLVMGSCLFPIIQVSKKSVKGLLFSEIKNSKHFSIVKSLIGLGMILGAFLLVNTDNKSLQMPFSFLGLIVVSVGAAMMIPTLAIILSKLLGFVMTKLFGYHVKAATTQISNDKTLMNTIILLSMGLGIILMINNFSSSVANLVVDVYGKGRADIIMMYHPFEKEFIEKVNATKGVTHTYATQDLFEVKANKGSVDIPILEGIDGKGFADYAWDEFGYIFTDELQNTFRTERTIIISTLTANNNHLKVNDMVNIDFNGTEVPYRVLKIVPSIMNNGTISFIHDSFFAQDNKGNQYMALYVNTNEDPDVVINRIKKQAPLAMLPLESLEEMKQINIKSNESMFSMMKAISLIAMLIGSIGIFNNYIISFISRRKFIASLRSLGVTKYSLMKLFIAEAILSGIIGSLGGLTVGYIIIEIMKGVLENMNIASQLITHSVNEMVFVGVCGIVLGLIGAIIPASSNIRRPIIPELKYE